MFPIFISGLASWLYFTAIVPLGYIYQDFPGQEAQVMLIASLPGLFAMAGAFAAAPLMRVLKNRNLVIISLSIALIGGLMVRFVGAKSLLLCIVGSSITGIPAGIIPVVNYAMLAEIAPENLRDKVCGWSDAMCTFGLIISSFLAGLLAQDGDWAKAFACFYLVIPVLVIVLLLYPRSDDKVLSATVAGEKTSAQEEGSYLPKSVIGIVIVKFFAGFFCLAVHYNISDYIINELQIGTSSLVGTASTFAWLFTALGSLFIFLWFKFFRGSSTLVSELIMGICMILMVLFPSRVMCIMGWMFMSVGLNTFHSACGTLAAMAPKGKMVGLASSLFMGATFSGEFFGAYVPAIIAEKVFGSSLPSQSILIGGIFCIVFGFISLPFCMKAYDIAFGKKN